MPWGAVVGAAIGAIAQNQQTQAEKSAATDESTATEAAEKRRIKMADEAEARQLKIHEEQQERLSKRRDEDVRLAQEREEEWEEMFGPIEQNLADHYKNLTPDTLAAAGLQDEAENFARTATRITTSLAQKRIGGSGLEADLLAKSEISSAEKRADIRKEAREDVIKQKSDYLNANKQDRARYEAGTDKARRERTRSEEDAANTELDIVGDAADRRAGIVDSSERRKRQQSEAAAKRARQDRDDSGDSLAAIVKAGSEYAASDDDDDDDYDN